VLERTRRHYLDQPPAERRTFVDDGRPRLRIAGDVFRAPTARRLRSAVRRVRAETVGRVRDRTVRDLARQLRAGTDPP